MAGKAGNSGFFGLTRLGDRSQVLMAKEGRKERLLPFDRLPCRWHLGPVPVPDTHEGVADMAGTVQHGSLVQQFASMKPADFGPAIEPKWQLGGRLIKQVQTAVEKQELPPLDGARVISSITATLFGYDEFILREMSAESLLATTPPRR